MQTAHINGERDVRLIEHQEPVGEDEVLVRIHSGSICDSDKLRYQNAPMPKEVHRPSGYWGAGFLGHEGGGIVQEVGSKVREFKPGDQVMVFGNQGSLSDFWVFKAIELEKVPEGLDMNVA